MNKRQETSGPTFSLGIGGLGGQTSGPGASMITPLFTTVNSNSISIGDSYLQISGVSYSPYSPDISDPLADANDGGTISTDTDKPTRDLDQLSTLKLN